MEHDNLYGPFNPNPSRILQTILYNQYFAQQCSWIPQRAEFSDIKKTK